MVTGFVAREIVTVIVVALSNGSCFRHKWKIFTSQLRCLFQNEDFINLHGVRVENFPQAVLMSCDDLFTFVVSVLADKNVLLVELGRTNCIV